MRAAAALVLLATGAGAATPDSTVRFITCPIYRDADSGKKSGCWLADDRATGLRYDVSVSPSKPDWNHEVLVEGNVSSGARDVCGGVVLDAVRTSVLPGPCTRQMLPAEGFTGRKFVLPVRNVRPAAVPRDTPPGPYAARSFHLFFDFDAAFLIYQYDDYLLDEAITWLRAAKPRAITVTGYAATIPTNVSGRMIAEDPAIARVRAEKIGEALARLGIDRRTIKVRWRAAGGPVAVAEADDLPDASRRRVDISAVF
ncbi:hypothetical protein Q4F19_12695 [Sphingomonas sp. BIUV-7]|uniref:OmpA-like domain-containing protein n=1 Tax=Sphingomonas natans TaxID=3063330 RepID=A0ABT8YBN4_9SPHN|nr:hypothetical protein [Sphingomonas sp. BIUV-7]MDO6415243.1 hypothetical protein [Sphingomonas sp. BIUV-7]